MWSTKFRISLNSQNPYQSSIEKPLAAVKHNLPFTTRTHCSVISRASRETGIRAASFHSLFAMRGSIETSKFFSRPSEQLAMSLSCRAFIPKLLSIQARSRCYAMRNQTNKQTSQRTIVKTKVLAGESKKQKIPSDIHTIERFKAAQASIWHSMRKKQDKSRCNIRAISATCFGRKRCTRHRLALVSARRAEIGLLPACSLWQAAV